MDLRGGKNFRTKAERRAIVEEAMMPRTSVSAVARQHGVNTNQVFHWRRQYRAGQLEERAGSLVPVRIVTSVAKRPRVKGVSSRSCRTGSIEIQFGAVRLRIEGAADPDCVRAAVEGLR